MQCRLGTTLSLVLLVSIASGCSLSGKPRGASLSDAVEQAKREPDEKKEVVPIDPEVAAQAEDSDTVSVFVNTVDALSGLLADDATSTPPPSSQTPTASGLDAAESDDTKWHFGALVGFGYQSGDEFNRYGLFGLNVGNHSSTQRLHGDFGVVIATVQPKPGSSIAGAIKDEIEASFDLGVRYYLTPSHTFSGIYAFGGLRYGALGWHWTEPIEVEGASATETIEHDLIGVASMYIGMGLSVVQTRYFKLGVNGSVGFKLYHDTTLEGFNNDVFGSGGILQIMFPVTVGDFSP